MDLEYVKNYLRVDYDEDDELISTLIQSSHSYLVGAIDDFEEKYKFEKFKCMADLIMLTIISEWYDNRVYVKNNNYDKVSKIITSMIQQLQYS